MYFLIHSFFLLLISILILIFLIILISNLPLYMFVRPYFCTDQFLLLLSFFIINLYLLRHNVCSIFFAFVFCFVVVARFLSDQVMLATIRS